MKLTEFILIRNFTLRLLSRLFCRKKSVLRRKKKQRRIKFRDCINHVRLPYLHLMGGGGKQINEHRCLKFTNNSNNAKFTSYCASFFSFFSNCLFKWNAFFSEHFSMSYHNYDNFFYQSTTVTKYYSRTHKHHQQIIHIHIDNFFFLTNCIIT